MDQLAFYSRFHCCPTQLFLSPTCKFLSFPANQTGRWEKLVWILLPIIHHSLAWKGTALSLELDPTSLHLTKLNSYKKSNKKAKLVERAVHIGGSCLIMTHLLAFPVQSFLLKAVGFSLMFLSSSILIYWISQGQPYQICQTWFQRKQSKVYMWVESGLSSGFCGVLVWFSWTQSNSGSGSQCGIWGQSGERFQTSVELWQSS